MGLFGLGKQETAKQETQKKQIDTELELMAADIRNKQDVIRAVRTCCDIISESNRQIKDAKIEYRQVTSYLTDIQKIDRIQGDERKNIDGAAKNILNLMRERNRYKNRSMEITDRQILQLEPYEETLADEIKKMYDNEIYQTAIKSDMSHLEGEKAVLLHERSETVAKQGYLKFLAKMLCVLVISLLVLLGVMNYVLEVDMVIPYMLTIVFSGFMAIFIFMEGYRNRQAAVLTNRKLDRAIMLLNRVKIKYVNNTNVLDYTYEKFGVDSAKQFEFLWEQYCKVKEYERKFKENTLELQDNMKLLLHELKQHQVRDTEVWVPQVAALLDEREMVEVRHKLNTRRQHIRKRIDYNKGNRDKAFDTIGEILDKKPEVSSEILAILKEYNMAI